jgi:Ca2+-binding RTX toxin-like protein
MAQHPGFPDGRAHPIAGKPVAALPHDGSGRVVVPSADLLTGGHYQRLGSLDLLLTGEDGQQAVIRDFFADDALPDLVSPDGALIRGETAAQLAGTLAPGQYAQIGAIAARAPSIGQIETVKGDATILHADGSRIAAHQGMSLHQGDVIETGKGGIVGLVMADSTTLSLGGSGRIVLDRMVYDADSHTGQSSFSLVQGAFSFVSGHIAKSAPDAMTIRTPVATLGIRGTVGTGGYTPQTGLTAALLPEGGGISGEISIVNAVGTQVINQANSTVQVASYFTAPTPPVIVPLAQLNSIFGGVMSTLPASPSNPSSHDAIRNLPADSSSRPPTGAAPETQAAAASKEMATVAAKSPDDPAAKAALEGAGKDGKPELVFAAAAQAAMNNAIARGASIEEAQKAAMMAKDAFDAAVTKGASIDQAMSAAVSAARLSGLAGMSERPSGIGLPTMGIDRLSVGQFSGQGTAQQTIAGSSPSPLAPNSEGPRNYVAPGTQINLTGFTSEQRVSVGEGGIPGVLGPNGVFQVGYVAGTYVPGQTQESRETRHDDYRKPLVNDFQERLVATTGNDVLTGGAGNTNFIWEQGSGAIPSGTIGGTDSVDGGGGTDQLTLANLSSVAGTADLVANLQTDAITIKLRNGLDPLSGAVQSTITMRSVEQLWIGPADGSAKQQIAIGDNQAGLTGYVVVGGTGDDTIDLSSVSNATGTAIFGGVGNDAITGTTVNDNIIGGKGNDTLAGGQGGDQYFYRSADSGSTGDGSDTIDDGGTDGLNDLLRIDTSNTLAIYQVALSGTSLLLTMNQAGDQLITIQNQFASKGVETLRVTTNGAYLEYAMPGYNSIAAPTAGNDTILGTSDRELMMGAAGDDSLRGGNGGDLLFGGGGNDTYAYVSIDGNHGTDVLIDSAGTDTITLSSLKVIGAAKLDYDGDGTADDLTLTLGSGLNDKIAVVDHYASKSIESLSDGANSYLIENGTGLTGSKILYAGTSGNDTLTGAGTAGNLLCGNDGNDTLSGDAGIDTLCGGAGVDTLTGNAGADLFSYYAQSDGETVRTAATSPSSASVTGDIITDFATGIDKISLLANSFSLFSALGGSLTNGANIVVIGSEYSGSLAAGQATGWDAGGACLIIDNFGSSQHHVIYDANGSADGYTVIATTQASSTVAVGDVQLVTV